MCPRVTSIFLLLALGTAMPAGAARDESGAAAGPDSPEPAVTERIEEEQRNLDERFTLLSHRPNYIIPFSHWSDPNEAPYAPVDGQRLEAQEAKFQLSIKVPVIRRVFDERSTLWFGYTQRAWWQLYNGGTQVSRPFRETNHEAELMLDTVTDFQLLGLRNRLIRIGLNHESNGQSRPLSRSWNRVYAAFVLEWHDLALAVRPWYRLPESEIQDDNPDITDYLGHFDLNAAWRNGDHQYSLMWRRNFATDRGAWQLDYSFPLNGKIRGYVQIFHGYGESLIDYNHKATRIGLGIQISSWL